MSAALALLAELIGNGVSLWREGDLLRWKVPEPALMTADLLRQLKAQKQALLELLSTERIVTAENGQQYVVRLYQCPTCHTASWAPAADGKWRCQVCAAILQHQQVAP